jgi:Tfp pilus assembly protein PilF
MGRWKDALADLEAALPAKADNADLHSDLAETYTALDVPELAETHRRRAEELQASSTTIE